jgi:tetratricopeptide (TPR) repeat protein
MRLLSLALLIAALHAPMAAPFSVPLFAEDSSTTMTLSQRLEKIRSVINLPGTTAQQWLEYGNALSESGDKEAAAAALIRATSLDPMLAEAWFDLGVLLKRGAPKPELEKAEGALMKALETGGPTARVLNELAVTLALRGRMKEAADLWGKALLLDPNWGVLYNNYFKACLQLGDELTVKSSIPAALATERFNDAAILQVGDYYVRRKRFAEAEALYRQAIAAHPNHMPFHYSLGTVLADLGKKEEARSALRKVMDLGRAEQDNRTLVQQASWEIFRLDHPADEKKFQEARAFVFAGERDASKLEKDLKAAVKLLGPLLEKHPDFWNGFFVRGVALRRLNERPRAEADLRRVLELNADEPNATMELALLLRDEMQFEQSAALARRAVEIAPRDPVFAVNAGFIHIDAGNCEAAWGYYQTVLRMVGEQNAAVLRDQLDVRCPMKATAP